MAQDKIKIRKKQKDIFDMDVTKKGNPHHHIKRKIIMTLLVIAVLLAINVAYAVKTLEGDAIDPDPEVVVDTDTLYFNFTITNKGYIPVEFELTLELYDLRNGIDLGDHDVTVSLDGGSESDEGFIVSLTQDSVDAAESAQGLVIRYTPTVSGTYLDHIPLPEMELDPDDVTVHA